MMVGAYSGVIPDLRNKILDCLMGAGRGFPAGMELPKACRESSSVDLEGETPRGMPA